MPPRLIFAQGDNYMNAESKCVLVNTEQDLDKILSNKNKVIALVYASWCPFCRNFLPVFEKYVSGEGFDFVRVQDDQECIGEKYNVDIFPTVLFFEKGKVAMRLDGEPGVGLSEKQLADFVKICRA
ncbi:MAG TPA: thioredoxin [Deltaproteobacteria bacterium]|nr:thioredoxin [Deltaproteobacteria bacterium]